MLGPGLSLEQAPPLAAPLRFFLAAPAFLAAAGLLAAARPEWSSSLAAPATLALTHLLTLGFLGMVMLGALTQMLPVVAGAPLPAVRPVARLAHAGLLLGTPTLAWGLAQGETLGIELGAGLLGAGLTVFIAAAALGLARIQQAGPQDTTQAMRLALLALGLTLILGLGLAAWLAGYWQPDTPESWLRGHVLWGLAGWIGVLVMGSAWQVVPMLQLTPAYPRRLARGLLLAVALALPAAAWLAAQGALLGEGVLAVALAGFALATLDRQRRRKRKLADTTLDFWRLGMGSLILAMLLVGLDALRPLPETVRLAAGILFLLGFAASVVVGMLYKILPFLAWFHLQGQRGFAAGGLPSMRDYLPEARARGQFRLYLAALACLVSAPFAPFLALPGGLLLTASAIWLGWNLWRVRALFRQAGGRL